MNSRMDKYYNSSNGIGARSKKNAELYKEVNKQVVEDFNVNSNASVLSDNGTNIDLAMLKDMLDKRYKDSNKRRSIKIDDTPFEEEKISFDNTKEYDINAILEKARENKTVDYEKERLKKIRDTQYDILKSLDFSKKDEEGKKQPTKQEEQLMTLINTISLNEQNIKDNMDPLDLFADLKGDDNDPKVSEPAPVKEEKNINTDKIKKVVKEEMENQIDRSFYTGSFNLSKNDFEDFKDLQEDVKSNKVLVTILTIIVVLAFLFGLFLFLNIYFKWGIL